MSSSLRLDVYLVKNGFAENRTKAQQLIKNGNVSVNNKVVLKPAFECDETCVLDVKKPEIEFVSRGAYKLLGAIKDFNLNFNNKCVLDVGSSTGGFCDCALKNGAKLVVAVDVGQNQLHKTLRESKKVLMFEKTDIRELKLPNDIRPEILTADLSFISLTKVVESFKNFSSVKEFILLIKPQFECGMLLAKKYKGVITNFEIHRDVILRVITVFEKNELYLKNLSVSPIKGGDGNVEYLAYFTRNYNNLNISETIDNIIRQAKQKGAKNV